ncbi:benzoate/H(+) symporter BenE family transporter [Bacteriovorax sp. PP10]|uniref:Benzoate/H(+) symporter BenE family transporter n=1 Tax=Bacteriovorax antarcticus TaxID=3088717 RepID=A0ABU5VWM3_9BACT|nr:benzoate/H(+) symporter BenE family transporter [Bacteriovorax sp. PP10]MEA9357454.1 benzoate/H(+) symporter BenE family transporter [Bacteriovorax sp. PP10]
MKNIMNDFSLSTIVAGFIAVLVGYTSSAVIVFQAATAAGASAAQAGAWLGIICVAMGILTISLSAKYKIPIMFAWSTPGAALLITSVGGFTLSEVIGVFIFSAAMIFLCGVTGFFEKMMNKIPVGIASAMLAGILLHFAFEVFTSMKTQIVLSMVMFFTYMIGRRFFQRYNIIVVLVFGVMVAWLQNLLHFTPVDFTVLRPEFIAPTFSLASIIGVGIPLFIVTMTSQNMTGVAVIKAFDYKPQISKIIGWSGFVNLLIAPFGGYTINLAALTAAICMGPESHPDETKRYTAAISSGIIYIFIGLFSSAIVGIFVAFPKELIMTIAGLALIGTINSGIISAVHHEADREASMMTFFVTASGVSLFGIGSAFWGLVAGCVFSLILKLRK